MLLHWTTRTARRAWHNGSYCCRYSLFISCDGDETWQMIQKKKKQTQMPIWIHGMKWMNHIRISHADAAGAAVGGFSFRTIHSVEKTYISIPFIHSHNLCDTQIIIIEHESRRKHAEKYTRNSFGGKQRVAIASSLQEMPLALLD